MAFMLITACSPQRKIERAKQIVITNKPAFDSVGYIWSTLHPCVSDTVVHEKTDTIVGESMVYIDTISVPYENIKYIYKTINTTPTIIEKKITAYVTDERQVNELTLQLQKCNIEKANLNTTILQKDLQKLDEHKKVNTLWYWIVGLVVVLIGSHIIRYKFKL